MDARTQLLAHAQRRDQSCLRTRRQERRRERPGRLYDANGCRLLAMTKLVSEICKWIGLPGATIVISCAALTWLIGCAANRQPGEVAAGTTGKGGAELWADNCVRCHNIRSPSNYSAA